MLLNRPLADGETIQLRISGDTVERGDAFFDAFWNACRASNEIRLAVHVGASAESGWIVGIVINRVDMHLFHAPEAHMLLETMKESNELAPDAHIAQLMECLDDALEAINRGVTMTRQ